MWRARTLALALFCSLGLAAPWKIPESRAGEERVVNQDVVAWVREAPFDDPIALQKTPSFSYEGWIARGRALPQASETLIAMLEHEDLPIRRATG